MKQDGTLAAVIEQATSVAEMGAACHNVAAALGFEHFLYGFRVPVPLSEPCQLIISGYPEDWTKHYDEQRYLAIDPVLSHGLTTVVPYAWDELDRSKPRVAQLFREAAHYGLRHGFSVAVHGAHGEGGLLSLARERPLPARHEQRMSLFQRAHWFTALMHHRLRRIGFTDTHPPELRPLTPRERECLFLAAEGYSANVIGRGMNITERTVVFHLSRAEQKLGARRRQQAVARAVALGAIEPKVYPDRLNESKQLVQVPKRPS